MNCFLLEQKKIGMGLKSGDLALKCEEIRWAFVGLVCCLFWGFFAFFLFSVSWGFFDKPKTSESIMKFEMRNDRGDYF